MNQSKKIIVALTIFLMSGVGAYSSCGTASCPIDTHTIEKIEKGLVRLEYSFEYVDLDQARVGRSKVSIGEIEGEHNEIYTVNRIHRLSADVGVTSRLNLQIVLPYVNRSHQHLHVHDDELETWNMNGLGDLRLLSHYAWINPDTESKPRISSILGLQLATGKDDEKNHHGGEAEVGIQPGSGATSFIFGVSSLQKFSVPMLSGSHGVMPFFVSTTYQLNGEGKDNYTLGDVWLSNIGIIYPASEKWGFSAQINTRVTKKDEEGHSHGVVAHHDTDRTGGSYVYLSPGFQFNISRNTGMYATIQIPVYQRVNEIQLTSDANFLLGISSKFKAW